MKISTSSSLSSLFPSRLSQFDDEVDRIKSEVAAIVSTSKDNAKLLKGFEELWDIYRKRLESRLSRRKL